MNAQKWVKNWFLSFTVLILLLLGINFSVDPFWVYKHENILNQVQKPFNERQQKTNYIYFNGFPYDSLLLGSSRTTYINQNNFKNMNVYNYGLSYATPFEFKSYIDFVKERSGKELKYILLGMDFFGTNDKLRLLNKDVEKYVKPMKGFCYKCKNLLNLDTTKGSFKNIFYSIKGASRLYYDRHNIKYRPALSTVKRLAKYNKNIIRKTSTFTNTRYVYSEYYKDTVQKIKNSNKETVFIVFTTPVTDGLLLSILKQEGRMKDYERWLHDLVSVFGSVHHFMDLNDISKNHLNYFDSEHFYPKVGTILAHQLTRKHENNNTINSEIILTKDNIDQYLKDFKERVSTYTLD